MRHALSHCTDFSRPAPLRLLKTDARFRLENGHSKSTSLQAGRVLRLSIKAAKLLKNRAIFVLK